MKYMSDYKNQAWSLKLEKSVRTGSDNCDYNFGTFLLKMTRKYHIIWYWCQDIWDSYMVEEDQKIRARPERSRFFSCSLSLHHWFWSWCWCSQVPQPTSVSWGTWLVLILVLGWVLRPEAGCWVPAFQRKMAAIAELGMRGVAVGWRGRERECPTFDLIWK